MKCPSCGLENGPNETWCDDCGAMLTSTPVVLDQRVRQPILSAGSVLDKRYRIDAGTSNGSYNIYQATRLEDGASLRVLEDAEAEPVAEVAERPGEPASVDVSRAATVWRALHNASCSHLWTPIDFVYVSRRGYVVGTPLPTWTLQDYLQDAELQPAREVRAIGLALLEAVAVLHERGFLHLGVCPASIYIDEDGAAVLDGYERLAPMVALPETCSVIEGYSAPEAYGIGGRPCPASDVYSVGATMYHVLTHSAPTPVSREQFFVFAPPSSYVRNVPSDLEQVIMKALGKDPAKRWPTAEAMCEALTAATGEPCVGATTQPSETTPPHPGPDPDADGAALPQSIPDADSAALPRSIPDADGGALPRSVHDADGDALPRSVPDADGGALPRSVPDADGGTLPRSIHDADGDALSRSIHDADGDALSRSVHDAHGDALPRSVHDADGGAPPSPGVPSAQLTTLPRTHNATHRNLNAGLARFIPFRLGLRSHVGGVRSVNQDSMLFTTFSCWEHSTPTNAFLLVVADGMGGEAEGDTASSLALRAMASHLLETQLPLKTSSTSKLWPTDPPQKLEALLREGIEAANRVVFDYSQEDAARRGMGTTLTAVMFENSTAVFGHAGDTRALLLRNGSNELDVITEDHSLVGKLVRLGQMTREQARTSPQRSSLYRALGTQPDLEVDCYRREMASGDRLVICCDGVWEYFTDNEMVALIRSNDDPQIACDALINEVLRRGADDNATAALLYMT